MGYGLEVYDADGNVKLDMSKQITRALGTTTLNGDGSITSAGVGYPNNNLWYMVLTYASPANSSKAIPALRIDANGKRIFWRNQVGTKIRYGVY